MMTDTELLKLAAKAAGYQLHLYVNDIHHYEQYKLIDNNKHWSQWKVWNPLENNDDAFKLMVLLRLAPEPAPYSCHVYVTFGDHGIDPPDHWIIQDSPNVDDYCYAARLAIVRAAAEIGRNME